MPRKAIVTGSSGFIGRVLCSRLLEEGYEVFGIQKEHSKRNVSNEMFHEIVNTDLEASDFDGFDMTHSIVFHFAWNGVSDKLASECAIQYANFEYSAKLMKVVTQIGCSRFIFAGSIFEYENFITKTITYDSSSLKKTYSYFKNLTDNYLGTYSQQLGIEYISCIISNIFGPNEKSNRFLNSLINNMNSNQENAISNCEQDYDFIYIDDAVNEIILCAENGLNNNRYYIGTGNVKPLKEYVEEVRNIVNPSYKLRFGTVEGEPTMFDFSEFNVSRVKRELGYNCKYSFSDGVKLVLKSIKEKK